MQTCYPKSIRKEREKNRKETIELEMLEICLPNSAVLELFNVLIDRNQFEEEAYQFCLKEIKQFLNNNWNNAKVQRISKRIGKRIRISAQIESVKNVQKLIDLKKESGETDENKKTQSSMTTILTYCEKNFKARPFVNSPEFLIQKWICKEAMKESRLQVKLMPGVFELLRKWRMEQFVKLFAWDNQCAQDIWSHLKQTTEGDASIFFNNCIQVPKVAEKDPAFYRSVATLLRDRPSNLLFVNSNQSQVQAAKESGFKCVFIQTKADRSSESNQSNSGAISSITQVQLIENTNEPRQIDRTCC